MASLANVNCTNTKTHDSSGYVFLCHSDVTKIACDAWLATCMVSWTVITDGFIHVGHYDKMGQESVVKIMWIYRMTKWPSYQQKEENRPIL